MKKITFLLSFAFLSLKSFSQLNGTYTVGGTLPDFPDLNTAVTSLLSSGVSGPVTFNIRDGVYTGKIRLNEIPGASSVNRIIFQSENMDSSRVTLQASSDSVNTDNYTILLDSADFITFRHLSVKRTGNLTYSRVIHLIRGATNNSFEFNRIEGIPRTIGTTNSTLLHNEGGAQMDSNLIIRNNRFLNGSYGIICIASNPTAQESGLLIENNIIDGPYSYAVQLGFQTSPIIRNNIIQSVISSSSFYGISCVNCNEQAIIESNRINAPNGGRGIRLSSSRPSNGLPILVSNNFVHIGGAGIAYGIELSSDSAVRVVNNSIHVTSTYISTYCLHVSAIADSSIYIRNNILANTGEGIAIYVNSPAVDVLILSDNNNLYATGDFLGFQNNSYIPNLNDWRNLTTMDMQSISVDPNFTSVSDLHTFASNLNNLGAPLAFVTDDIDGEPRNPLTPDIGADEFTPLVTNAEMQELSSPADVAFCGENSTMLEVTVRNAGTNMISSIPVVIEISGAITTTLLDTIPGPLAPSTSLTHVFSQGISTLAGGNFHFKIYTALSSDQFRSNDTIYEQRFVSRIPSPPTAQSTQSGCSTSAGITATAASGDIVFWYDEAIGGNLVGVGPQLMVPIHSDTVFYAESRDASRMGECIRISEVSTNHFNYIEIQNLGGNGFDATGWKVLANASFSNINSIHSDIWQLGYFNAGEKQFKTDSPSLNYWGGDLIMLPFQNAWVMLLDSNNFIRDFLPFKWDDTSIQNMRPVIDGMALSIGSQWTGDGYAGCPADTSISRRGAFDTNSAADFSCEPMTRGSNNANLDTIFSTCGAGECASSRVAVQVNLIPGSFNNLGPDTSFVGPFTYLLDAGSGFLSYEWSDGSTLQTLLVNTPGTYWVNVLSSNGCSYTDSVVISIGTGTKSSINSHALRVYPNPAHQHVIIEFDGAGAEVQLLDLQGKILRNKITNSSKDPGLITIDLKGISTGLYVLKVLDNYNVQTVLLTVVEK